MIDAAVGGAFISKMHDKAYELLKWPQIIINNPVRDKRQENFWNS
jgi:hypothetical protein